jgi:hypothetical protein
MADRLDIAACTLRFYPAFEEAPWTRRRKVKVTTKDGDILSGCKIRRSKGTRGTIDVPQELKVENDPNWPNRKFTLSDLDRDALRLKIEDERRYRPGDEPLHKPMDADADLILHRKAWATIVARAKRKRSHRHV